MEASANNDQDKIQGMDIEGGERALMADSQGQLTGAKQGGIPEWPRTDISKQKGQQEFIMEGHLRPIQPPAKQLATDPQPPVVSRLAEPVPGCSQGQQKSAMEVEESENKKSTNQSQINEQIKVELPVGQIRQQRNKKRLARQKLKDFQEKLRDSGSDLQHGRSRKKGYRDSQYNRAELNRIFHKPQTNLAKILYPNLTLRVDMPSLSFGSFASKFGFFDIVVIDQQVSTVFFLNPHRLVKDGLIFVWADKHQIHLGYHLLNRWGFDVIDQIMWVKTEPEDMLSVSEGEVLGETTSMCMVGFRNTSGKCFQYKTKVSNNLVFSERGKGRPGQIYEIAELMMPGSKKIDLYNRRKLEGWVCLQHVPQKPQPESTQIVEEKQPIKTFYQQFDAKCQLCGILRINHCCFECLTCKSFLCQSCIFQLNKPPFEPSNQGKKISPWHPPTHQWRIHVHNKVNYMQDYNCYYCSKKLIPMRNNYMCENCKGVYLCEGCVGKELPRKGCHNSKEHKLTLLV